MSNPTLEKTKNIYADMDDAALIRLLRGGDKGVTDFLMEKYKYLVRRRANALFLLGGDTDDLIQEGMIGLFKAVRDYDEQAGGFYSFAELCISRQIYTAIEAAARKKHGPLNSYVSLSREGANEDTRTLQGDYFVADEMNPERMLIDRENFTDFLGKIRANLSTMERKVLDFYLDGMNYRQIAREMEKPEKSIDNALQRIRNKSQKLMQDSKMNK